MQDGTAGTRGLVWVLVLTSPAYFMVVLDDRTADVTVYSADVDDTLDKWTLVQASA